MANSGVVEKALTALRFLPRVCLANLRPIPGSFKKWKRKRGQHGGRTHGHGNKGSRQRQSYAPIGFEGGQTPFHIIIPMEPYYKNEHLRRQYLPLTLKQLQLMIDTGRLDNTLPVDIAAICNTFLHKINPAERHFGFQLTDEGLDNFTAKVNIEIQHTTEAVIAAIERNGGVITTAYYDIPSLLALRDPIQFFRKGSPIPRRQLPPDDAMKYYTDPKFRGYLADPDRTAKERFALSQKYGYILTDITQDPLYAMLQERKDPRQIFYGLEPGWLINLRDKTILKPKDEELVKYYQS